MPPTAAESLPEAPQAPAPRPPWFAAAARWYSRRELPGWGRVIRLAGAFDEARWRGTAPVLMRGKWDRSVHELDLANWSERQTYFLGRFYDLPTQLLMRAALRPGDAFVDIGANVGMLTALGSHLVGSSGQVESFEPNPQAADKLARTVARNALSNVRLHRVALGDQPGAGVLRVVSAHTGCGTLAAIPQSDAPHISATHEVPIRMGDSCLADLQRPVRLIKIDVEGYECLVLRGLAGTIARDRPLIAAEVSEQLLQRAGSSTAELFALLESSGYRGRWIAHRRRLLRHELVLLPLTAAAPATWNNALFVPENPGSDRLTPALRRCLGR